MVIEHNVIKISNEQSAWEERMMLSFNNEIIGEMWYLPNTLGRYEIGIRIADPAMQGRGIGRAALSMLVEELLRQGKHTLCAEVGMANTRAQHVFELLGFKQTGRHGDDWKARYMTFELNKDGFINWKDFKPQ